MEILILFITPIVAALSVYLFGKSKKTIYTISLSAATVELVTSIIAGVRVGHSQAVMLGSLFSLHALSTLLLITIVGIGFFVTLHSVSYLEKESEKHMLGFTRMREYFILLHLFIFFMIVALVSESPIIMWSAIEATTLSTVFLISLFNRNEDIEAAWKYLIINSIGLLLGLLGTFIFLAQGNGTLLTWGDLLAQKAHILPSVAKMAFVFVFIGYATKMGIAPMHTWKPDAYNKAPLPIVALLAGGLMDVALFGILRFTQITDLVVGPSFTHMIFLIFGTLSVLIAGFTIYTQTNYKRLLAYHSIEHAGIILLGFGFGGIAIFGALLHVIYYSLSKALLSLASSNIALKYSSSEIHDVRGLVKVLPVTSIVYAIGFLFLMGVAPSGIFFSEFYILLSGFHQNVLIALILLGVIVLVFVGFVRHFLDMFFGDIPEGIVAGEQSRVQYIPLVILTSVILVLGVAAPVVLGPLLTQSVVSLKGIMP